MASTTDDTHFHDEELDGMSDSSHEYHQWTDDNNKDQQASGNQMKRRYSTVHKHTAVVPIADYESLDYDRCDNVPYKQWLDSYTKLTYFHVSLMRWIMVGVIGFLTGLTAFLINTGVRYLTLLKNSSFNKVYEVLPDRGMIFLGLLVLLGFNVLYGLVASTLAIIEPIAAGSGIPEIKCYLNGIRMPRVVRLRTLVVKATGVLFSVAGGFLVGKEGPMIHSGAIIGSGMPQLRSFVWRKLKLPYPYFRSDKDKRDFVSCGAAAGVAAAFGAPIGGVLFSLEEGSSFWDQGLTWRSLFCAMCSTFTLNLLLSATSGDFGELDQPGLINFGRFNLGPSENLWTFQYIFVFAAMGAVGGLMGAWFNSLNKHLTIYRMNHVFVKGRIFKLLEVILIAVVTTFSVFFLSTFLGTCVPVVQNTIYPNAEPLDSTQDYFCPVEGLSTQIGLTHFTEYFNDMATLLYNSEEEAVKQLFHQDGAFTLATLAIALIVYFFIACWTYGASIPSGIFVPCLTIGALYGRFIVTALIMMGFTPSIYAGTFALIGAASFLGGVVRMTVSLTIILIESTDEIEYGLPLLVTLMAAKWVGDLIDEGLYDIHIELKEIPLLGWGSPAEMDRLNAADVMSRDLKYVYPISRVSSIQQLLRTTAHNAFLVVTPMTFEPSSPRPTTTPSTDLLSTPKSLSKLSAAIKQPALYFRTSIRPIHQRAVIAEKRRQDAMKRQQERAIAAYSPFNLTDEKILQDTDTKDLPPSQGLKGLPPLEESTDDTKATPSQESTNMRDSPSSDTRTTPSQESTNMKDSPSSQRSTDTRTTPFQESTNMKDSPSSQRSTDTRTTPFQENTNMKDSPLSQRNTDTKDSPPSQKSIDTKDTLPPSQKNISIAKDEPSPLIFHGIILRSQLVTLLNEKILFHEDDSSDTQHRISHLELTADYPRYKSIFDVQLDDNEKNALMDVSLYMNPCPHTVSHHAPLPRVFNLFRTMGLRHLPVMEDSGIVVGMITRHDLTHEHLHDVLNSKKKKGRSKKSPGADSVELKNIQKLV